MLTGLEPREFTWVISDRLAVSERIGGHGFQHRRVRREEEITWLLHHGVTAVLSLLDGNQNLAAYEAASGTEMEDIQFFEVLSILRRLTDVAISVEAGAENQGMRPGAVEMMRKASGHIRNVYDLLVELTGLRLPEYEEFLNSL